MGGAVGSEATRPTIVITFLELQARLNDPTHNQCAKKAKESLCPTDSFGYWPQGVAAACGPSLMLRLYLLLA
jgi:hypothetical protein